VALDFGHDVFPQALARGEAIATHLLGAPVIDIGTPAALQLARELGWKPHVSLEQGLRDTYASLIDEFRREAS
jgi:nucleoside-diphosphate-sugar epimerase